MQLYFQKNCVGRNIDMVRLDVCIFSFSGWIFLFIAKPIAFYLLFCLDLVRPPTLLLKLYSAIYFMPTKTVSVITRSRA